MSSKNNQFIFHLAGSNYLYMFTDKVNSELDFLYTEMAFSDAGEITTAARNAASLDTSVIGNLSASVRDSLVNCSIYRCSVLRSGASNLVYDFEGTWAQLSSFLEDGGDYKPPVDPINTLPILSYTAKKHVYTTTSIPVMRWNTYISWDYKEKEPYASNSNAYSYELKYSLITEDGSTYGSIDFANLKNLDSGALSTNLSSFSNYDLNKKLESLGETRQKCAVLIRTRMNNSDLCSNWTIFYIYQLNASPTYMDGGTATPDGSTDTPPGRPDYYDPTDGVDDSDTSTSASTNKDSDIYNTNSTKLNTSDAISSLKTAVSSLSEVISLFGTVYSWLPGWLITMISVSIALLVIVGLVKLIIS